MKHRVLDLFLLTIVIIGGALAWQTGRERSRLSAEHARLARITGDLPVEDPSKVYVQALETGDPMHFAWRVYHPPNYKHILSHGNGGGTTFFSSSAEFIARVVFREDDEGQLQLYTNFSGGSSLSPFGDEDLAELLHDRWDKIRVEQLGARACHSGSGPASNPAANDASR